MRESWQGVRSCFKPYGEVEDCCSRVEKLLQDGLLDREPEPPRIKPKAKSNAQINPNQCVGAWVGVMSVDKRVGEGAREPKPRWEKIIKPECRDQK